MKTNNYFKIKETTQTTSEILNECRKLFTVYSYYDDTRLDKDFPPPKKLTTRYFKKNIEADEEYKNKSAKEIEGKGEFITLRERLLMEIAYFKDTGEHLDIENWTLCAGSRNAGGSVPRVGWGSGGRRLVVSWSYVDSSNPILRARAGVSPLDLGLEPLGSDVGLEIRIEKLEAFIRGVSTLSKELGV